MIPAWNSFQGYAPACANEWVSGVCEKPRVKCGECPNQAFLPVEDGGQGRGKTRPRRLRKRQLDALVRQAIVDCYNESEEVTGLYTMIENNLALPFQTIVLGVPVTVERVDLPLREEIVAVCRRGRDRQTVPLLNLRLPSPPPVGAEWIDAYRHWLGSG